MPTGLEKQTAQRATDCGETPLYASKVTAPRNPKLIRGSVEELKVSWNILKLTMQPFYAILWSSFLVLVFSELLVLI